MPNTQHLHVQLIDIDHVALDRRVASEPSNELPNRHLRGVELRGASKQLQLAGQGSGASSVGQSRAFADS